ncbi:AMP-binding protein [Microbulbifer sp. MLAF003]|uniref:AMP-binding protein n=1 Tax=unclassified Microbulbifer TaxID=2619833 RepID=UPI0024AD6873|nr:AMP-binding protein [Microbulbifer sp. MLAF003]WHI49185.1 AMP-binding protein [Microbulbifer sp. MLAF003]
MSIGHLDWQEVLSQAQKLSRLGALTVPDSASKIEDLHISGPEEILQVSKANAITAGAILMSSGGTTGKPKLTYTPYHQATARLLREWRPLGPDSVVLNLFNPGRLWGAHYFIQTLAEKSQSVSAPTGPFIPSELTAWLEVLQDVGVNTLAGAPTGLADFAQGLKNSGGNLPIHTIIWMAEPWTKAKYDTVQSVFPNAGFWCDYGSVETNSIAINTPKCDLEKYHLLEGQLIEPSEQGALLTRIGNDWTVPLIRYRLGDLIQQTTCRCGRPRALLVEGRADDDVSLCSALLSIGQILDIATRENDVEEAQLVLTQNGETRKSASELTLIFTGSADPEVIRNRVLTRIHNLASVAQQYPGAFIVKQVERLRRVKRTNKVPPIVHISDSNK